MIYISFKKNLINDIIYKKQRLRKLQKFSLLKKNIFFVRSRCLVVRPRAHDWEVVGSNLRRPVWSKHKKTVENSSLALSHVLLSWKWEGIIWGTIGLWNPAQRFRIKRELIRWSRPHITMVSFHEKGKKIPNLHEIWHRVVWKQNKTFCKNIFFF